MNILEVLKGLLLDPEFRQKRQFLQRVPVFRGVPRRQMGILFKALAARNYHRGEVLFSEGDIGRALFILESGRVELTQQGPAGRSQRLALLEPGDYFGEMALIEERPRTATATALEEVRAYLLYKTELARLLHHAPVVAATILAHLVEILSARLRTAMDHNLRLLESGGPTPKKPAKLQEAV